MPLIRVALAPALAAVSVLVPVGAAGAAVEAGGVWAVALGGAAVVVGAAVVAEAAGCAVVAGGGAAREAGVCARAGAAVAVRDPRADAIRRTASLLEQVVCDRESLQRAFLHRIDVAQRLLRLRCQIAAVSTVANPTQATKGTEAAAAGLSTFRAR